MTGVEIAMGVIAILGTAVGTYTAVQTANFNEKMANQDAAYAAQVGEVNADEARRNYLRNKGDATVTIANSGADLLSSSAVASFDESAAESLKEIEFIRMGARAEQRGHLITAASEKSKATNSLIEGGLSVAGSSLSGVDKYKKANPPKDKKANPPKDKKANPPKDKKANPPE